MLQQAIDFRAESQSLYDLLEPQPEAVYQKVTQFKNWTIDDVLGHLHTWNVAADLSLTDEDAFADFLAEVSQQGMRAFEAARLDGLQGRARLDHWREFYLQMTQRFADADPRRRLQWAGPDMSVRSSITARLMETWAHGQEVYDTLGVVRVNAERIQNIAVLGINTFGWTYQCRDLPPPENKPHVRLRAPSGAIWTWHEPAEDNLIEGLAEEFCQVVTQVRNIADTTLKVTGEVATQWMSMAQCFAGPPATPPPPGTRTTELSTPTTPGD